MPSGFILRMKGLRSKLGENGGHIAVAKLTDSNPVDEPLIRNLSSVTLS